VEARVEGSEREALVARSRNRFWREPRCGSGEALLVAYGDVAGWRLGFGVRSAGGHAAEGCTGGMGTSLMRAAGWAGRADRSVQDRPVRRRDARASG
jgi:hypothetical protein